MNEMESVMRRTPVGAFSEKIWSLDRRLYHPRTHREEAAAGIRDEGTVEGNGYSGLL